LQGSLVHGEEEGREEERAMKEVKSMFLHTYLQCFQYYAKGAKVLPQAEMPKGDKSWETLVEPVKKLSLQHKAEMATLYYFGLSHLEGEKSATYMEIFFGGITADKIDRKLVAMLDAIPEKSYAQLCHDMGYAPEKAKGFKTLLKIMRESRDTER
jgi:hypothetical protein